VASLVGDAAVARAPRAPLRPAALPAAATFAAGAAAVVLARGELSAWGVVAAATAGVLVWLAAIDLESRLIPNRIVLPAAAAVLAVAFALDPSRGAEHAVAAAGVGGCLLLAASLRPDALGMGDVKLGMLLGALLGADVLDALTIGFVLVAAVGLVAVVRDGRAALKRQLPLAPFLAAGAIATLLLG
jgi:leader peptidase (prepilin peptidase)/N-methyltransferase